MNKLFQSILLVLAVLMAVPSCAQEPNARKLRADMEELIGTACLNIVLGRYAKCEENIDQYLAIYEELNALDSTLITPAALYFPNQVLGTAHTKQGNWELAIKYLEEAIYLLEKHSDTLYDQITSTEYFQVYLNLTSSYCLVGRHQDALRIALENVALCRKNYPKHLASELYYLGMAHVANENYSEAIDCYKECLDLWSKQKNLKRREVELAQLAFTGLIQQQYKLSKYRDVTVSADEYGMLFEVNDKFYDTYRMISNSYIALNLSEKAFSLSQSLIKHTRKHFGKYSIEHAGRVGDLASLYANYYEQHLNDTDALNKAKEQYEQCLLIWDNIPMKETHKGYSTALNNYGALLFNAQDYKNAEILFAKSLDLDAELLPEPNLNTLHNIALIRWTQGDPETALEILHRSLLQCENTPTETHELQIHTSILLKLAEIYSTEIGDVQLAEKYANEAYVILEKLDNRDLVYATSLQVLGQIYSQIGNHEQSLQMQRAAIQTKLELYESIAGNPTDWIALAQSEGMVGNHEEAVRIINQVLNEQASILDKKNRAAALDVLGVSLSAQGEFAEAEPLLLEAAAIRKDVYGENSSYHNFSLNSLANLYSHQGDYAKAHEINLNLLAQNPDGINAGNVIYTDYLTDNLPSLESHLPLFYQISIEEIKQRFSFLSEKQREAYVASNVNLESIFTYANHFPQSALCAQYAFNTALVTKAMLLNTSKGLHELIAEVGDEQAQADYAALVGLRNKLDLTFEEAAREKISFQIGLKEKALQEFVLKHGEYTKHLDGEWTEVKRHLKANELAVEFVSYYEDLVGDDETEFYAALLLRSDWDAPKLVKLCTSSELQELLAGKMAFQASKEENRKQLAKMIWNPLTDYIADGEKLYFSPAGLLHQLPIETLPMADGRLVSENYELYRLSSTSQICQKNVAKPYERAALYGGLTYEVNDEAMVAQSEKYAARDAFAMRGFDADTLYRAGWSALKGAYAEVKDASERLASSGVAVQLFTGGDGSEESFRTLSGQSCDLIHLATHGFFLPLKDAQMRDFYQYRSASDNAMYRSGLILAGGNRAWKGEEIPTGVEDGVLTAQEISALDLSSTDLAVLSACETGLGEVSGEGVYGLQRAFKQAGVQTLIMSLWKVNDEVTQVMMNAFYQNLSAGKSKRESFQTAQALVRSKYPEAYYWSVFILLD